MSTAKLKAFHPDRLARAKMLDFGYRRLNGLPRVAGLRARATIGRAGQTQHDR